MKALKFFKDKGLILTEVPVPPLEEGEVLVRVKACSICGSDARILKGEKSVPDGVTLGHEIGGVIHKSRNPSLKEGEKVTVFPSIFCKKCENCERGFFNLCTNKKTLGYALDGGFAEFVRIPKELVELGAVVKTDIEDFAVSSIVEPLGCVLNSFGVMGLQPDSSLLIIGGGPLGLMHALVAHIQGIKTVFIADHHPERLKLAKRLNPRAVCCEDLSEVKRSGFDAVAMCAFAPDILEKAVSLCRAKGVVNLFAGGSWEKRAVICPNEIHYREKCLTGTHSTTLKLFRKAEKMALKHERILRQIITHRFPLTEYKKAFETYTTRKGLKVSLIP
ncbi:MAG: alcohol dehydrogenase catalytic domain-containing protein [Deferribacteres bacterium]|nr:alcohol dehydrogenase catalytic domain-containing protein [Deferribacteres bacterium]